MIINENMMMHRKIAQYHYRLKYITKYQKGVHFERLFSFLESRVLISGGRFQVILSPFLYLIWL